MVIIKIIAGPYAGQVRRVRDNRFRGMPVDPVRLLTQLMQRGSRWEIDYSQADRNEIVDWGRADLTVRYLRALYEGRPVRFMGGEYRATAGDQKEAVAIGQQIEDIVSTSGHYVFLESDDENGVSIGIGPREHRLQ